MASAAQPVATFSVHNGKIPVSVFTSAPHVFQHIVSRARNNIKVVADIDNTMLFSDKTLKERPLGSSIIKYLTDEHGAEVTYVTAREGKSKTSDSTWNSTFFELYNVGATPEVTKKRNSIVLFEPPAGYARMSESKKDLAVELFKQEQRKKAGKKLFLTIGDCVWDGLGSHADNPHRLNLDELFSHKLFTKAFFLFGDGVKPMPAGACSQFFLLMPASAQKKLMETPDLMRKTGQLLRADGGGRQAKPTKPRSRKRTTDGTKPT